MHLIRVSSFFGLVLLLLLVFSNCATVNKQVRELRPRDAARIAPYAMMAANSYHRKCDWFPLRTIGWVQVDLAGKPTDDPTYSHRFSLASDIFRNDRRGQFVNLATTSKPSFTVRKRQDAFSLPTLQNGAPSRHTQLKL